MIDEAKLSEFLGRFVADLGATMATANVVIGDQLGLYRELAQTGPCTPAELADRTGIAGRWLAEWLAGQAAGGYVTYDSGSGRYSLSPEQAFALAEEHSPAFVAGAFQLAAAAVRDEPAVTEALRAGTGLGWHQHNPDVVQGCERFFRPGYAANLIGSWIPALDGVADRLNTGARVADVGCGHGASTVLLAEAFPACLLYGFDAHHASVEWARKAASDAGVADQVQFEVAAADRYPGHGYDLVCTFDLLFTLADPVGVARRVRASLAPDGVWLLVEPAAGDRVEDNLNPVGRAYYGLSTLLGVPGLMSREAGPALGAQAGEARLREVATRAGFSRFRRAAETPFNHVYEVRG